MSIESDDEASVPVEIEIAQARVIQVFLCIAGSLFAHRTIPGGLSQKDSNLAVRVSSLALSIRAAAGLFGRFEWITRKHTYPLAALQVGATSLFPDLGHIFSAAVAGWSIGGVVLPRLLLKDSVIIPKPSLYLVPPSQTRGRGGSRCSDTISPRMIDTTGDGVRDSIIVDTNGDGRLDTVIPINRNFGPNNSLTGNLLSANMNTTWYTETSSTATVSPEVANLSIPSLANGTFPPLQSKSRQRTITIDQLQLLRKIGSGNSATVYLGTWRGVRVAIKEMVLGSQQVDHLAEEANRLQQISHPHIVSYYSHCVHKGRLIIVMEYCSQGSLEAYITSRRRVQDLFTIQEIVQVAQEVALAMVSVHQDGCIHRDLAARNIFRADGIYKLGDFGLVRSINNGGFYKSQSSDIPVNWTSPETLNTKVFTKANDVWSFGVLLWETLTYCSTAPFHRTSIAIAEKKILNGEILERPQSCPSGLWNQLVAPCFKPAEERPTFPKLAFKLIPDFSSSLAESPIEPTTPESTFYKTSSSLFYGSAVLCSSEHIQLEP